MLLRGVKRVALGLADRSMNTPAGSDNRANGDGVQQSEREKAAPSEPVLQTNRVVATDGTADVHRVEVDSTVRLRVERRDSIE